MHTIGLVQSLTLRPANSSAPRAVACARAIEGVGLEGDRHADPYSPRQILLAGSTAYATHALADYALRENLLLDIDTAGLASGSLLLIGTSALLWLTFQCEPCGQLDIDARQGGLAKRIQRRRGMLARVLRGGEVRKGDSVKLMQEAMPPWSDDWRVRFACILARVPDGMVVEYGRLARLAGVQPAYCRVFPKMAGLLGLSHKLVSRHGDVDLPRWDGLELFAINPSADGFIEP